MAVTAPPSARPTPVSPGRPTPVRRDRNSVFFRIGLTVASVAFLYPFWWVLTASLKPRSQVFDNLILPRNWAFANYLKITDAAPVWTWFVNSVTVAIAAAVAVTISSAMVAWAFAYYRFPGRNGWFGLVLATMMLPGAVTMIPVYLIWNSVGLATTQVPLWATNLFGSAFYIFLLRQFFLGLPRDLFEAARIDGVGHFGLFWRIAVPLCKPALIVTFVFELKASWSDLLKPLIYLRDVELFTLPRGLKAISDRFGQAGEQQWEIVLAGSVITVLPMVIVFFLAQRHFIHGIATQGRKG